MKSETGYNIPKEDLVVKPEGYLTEAKYSLPVAEQETSILYMRDEDFATIYTSDSTQMTRLDKLCKNNPEFYSLISQTSRSKLYKCTDKSLISFRAKKKEMSEEMKTAASERFKKLHAEGKVGKSKKQVEE